MVEWPSGLASGVSWAIQKAGVVADLAMGKSLLANTSKVRLTCLFCPICSRCNDLSILTVSLECTGGFHWLDSGENGEAGRSPILGCPDSSKIESSSRRHKLPSLVYGLSSIGCLGFSAGGHHAAQHQDACSCVHNV